ncbi:MAG: hypothetical protein OEZ06_23820 [Myxococcales bacterium]|nr:hypothetical protein [Myxococcales bacterium]
MKRSNWLVMTLACLLATSGCGDDSSTDGPSGGSGGQDTPDGGGNGGSGNGGELCINPGDINLDCPASVPFDGECAQKDLCCRRSSNAAKVEMLGPDDPAVLEYRLSLVEVQNHPDTIGLPPLLMLAANRAQTCSGEQCLLWRFTFPREGGQYVAGPGKSQIGIGRYNCDGTYSFYGDSAAPTREGLSDGGRWAGVEVDTEVNPDAEGRDRQTIPFADNPNRNVTYSPFLRTDTNEIDWELGSQGFDIVEIDTSDAGMDCMGSRDGENWITGGSFVSYSPLAPNTTDIADDINQTYCQLLAFGILTDANRDLDCLAVPRCTPGDADCPWLKLPDSLCPESDEDKALWGCHLGVKDNINGEAGYPTDVDCSDGAPTSPLDPAQGATSGGQCCDPLGESSTLPACNAYRTVQKYVASAVEITDAPKNDLPPVCSE